MTQNAGGANFITFEGIDGAGKSSQIARCCAWLDAHRLPWVQTREPGGTPLGEQLRALLLHEAMDLETEALLMFAARKQHLAELIEPRLAEGTWVVSDRFTDATFAYQVGGRGLDLAKFEALERWVHPNRQPDLTFLFDLDPAVAAVRLAGGSRTLGSPQPPARPDLPVRSGPGRRRRPPRRYGCGAGPLRARADGFLPTGARRLPRAGQGGAGAVLCHRCRPVTGADWRSTRTGP